MSPHAAQPGTVYLVGAGPGDSGLVTRRALELVRSADVLLVDRLIPHDLIDEARADAERIDVGKTAGNHAMPQEEINQRLVDEALAGRRVVRVKGGDPYLFGRGGEEAIHCREAGVPFEVVPAVTSAFAACADAGIPVTHRDLSRHVTVVTASAGRDGQGDPDYGWLAQSDGTLVLLMGLRRVAHVAEQLVAGGMSPDRPAAVISRGTTSDQRTVTATISTLAAEVEAASLASPAIIVVGETVALREQLGWFEQRPLFNTHVAVTRARAQSSALVAQLTTLGASVAELPAIRIEPLPSDELDALLDERASLEVLVLTSRNGADALFTRLADRGLDSRALAGIRIAAVGSATAEACAAHGITPDIVPPAGARTSLGLLDELCALGLPSGWGCGVVRAEQGDERFLQGLVDAGARVVLARAYRTVVEPASDEQVADLLEADVVTFTSESTVRHVLAMLEARGMSVDELPPAVTIGPTTSAAARDAGLYVAGEASDPGIEPLVEAVQAWVARVSS
jgi:uroporphyrinogen III methyltransferase/synthase